MQSARSEPLLFSFPHHLKRLRKERGWSQARLAEQLGTDVKTVSRWERGETVPAISLHASLSALFAVSVSDLGLLDDDETFRGLSDPALPLLPPFPLVGRDQQLAMLRERLCSGQAMTLLSGLPGVGKTALLVQLSHDPEIRAHFRDGILWAGLGPVPNLLGHVLRWGAMLEMPLSEMHDSRDLDAWCFALHRAIGSRTMLLVLDDVWRVEDALALKVGGPNCCHLISTRFPSVAARAAVDNAVVVEELDLEAGVELMRRLSPQVVEQEREGIGKLVEAVGGLPLALTLMGHYLRVQSYRHHPRRAREALQLLRDDAIARFSVQESRSPAERHATLPGTPLISLRSILAVSDQMLSEPARRALYALSAFPPKPNSFSEETALIVTGSSVEVLDQLVDMGLVQVTSDSRYMLHPTIADYACLHLEQNGDFDLAHQRLITSLTTFVERHRFDFSILEKETDNIFAALEASCTLDGVRELPRLACAFAPYLLVSGLASSAAHHLKLAYHMALLLEDEEGQRRVKKALTQIEQEEERDHFA